MSPRFIPPRLEDIGIEAVFERRKLNFELFKLMVNAGNDNTSIARVLSQEYTERMGIPIKIAPKTVKSYKSLL